YFSALCNLQFTASQYALISAASSVFGRIVTDTTAGALIERLGYVSFYLLTALAALPGILLFWYMMRSGLVDRALGDAGKSVPAGPRCRGRSRPARGLPGWRTCPMASPASWIWQKRNPRLSPRCWCARAMRCTPT